MIKDGTAYFVPDPRVMEDLLVSHLVSDRRPYKIVKTVTLGAMDYNNFITDMVADRQFIADNCDLCGKGDVWRCLFIRKRGQKDGVLVLPEDDAFVGWAAYVNAG